MALYKWLWRAVWELRVTAMTGHLGLYLEMRWADLPEVVITIIAAARLLADASTEEMATVLATSSGGFS